MPLNFVQSPPLGGAERHSKHPIHIFVSTNPFHRTTACKKGHYTVKRDAIRWSKTYGWNM